MTHTYINDAKLFKAFCDERRLKILELLRTGEKCACVLVDDMQIGQSALSYHMKILCDSGIVSARPDGKWIHYQLHEEACKQAIARLTKLTTPISTEIKCTCK